MTGAWARDANEPAELHGKCLDLDTVYRQRMAECLTHADYDQPQEYLLEALILHLYVVYASSLDFQPSVWMQYGTVARMAMRLGYHLDPRSLRDVKPYYAEMRRRVWTFIRQLDILYSFQIGLPTTLNSRWLVTPLPVNILDEDFGRQSDELAPARPETELTPVSYMIAKSKLVFAFAKALVEITQDDGLAYVSVLNVDNELRSIYQSMPPLWQIGDLGDTSNQEGLVVGLRLVLGAIYHKALCVIHSRYLKSAMTERQHLYSWLVCVDSAMTFLAFQVFIHRHIEPSGQDACIRRYQFSLTTHDFFLAATILCTALLLIENAPAAFRTLSVSFGPSFNDILATVEKSILIFQQKRGKSVEAARACERLTGLLSRLRPQSTPNDTIQELQNGGTNGGVQQYASRPPNHGIGDGQPPLDPNIMTQPAGPGDLVMNPFQLNVSSCHGITHHVVCQQVPVHVPRLTQTDGRMIGTRTHSLWTLVILCLLSRIYTVLMKS